MVLFGVVSLMSWHCGCFLPLGPGNLQLKMPDAFFHVTESTPPPHLTYTELITSSPHPPLFSRLLPRNPCNQLCGMKISENTIARKKKEMKKKTSNSRLATTTIETRHLHSHVSDGLNEPPTHHARPSAPPIQPIGSLFFSISMCLFRKSMSIRFRAGSCGSRGGAKVPGPGWWRPGYFVEVRLRFMLNSSFPRFVPF